MRLVKMVLAQLFLLALSQATSALGPAPVPAAVPSPPGITNGDAALIDLLPESTVIGVEIRNMAARWPEIRSLPAVTRFLDRLLEGAGLEADDLPGLAGDEAVLALVPDQDGRSLIPVALLNPPDPARAERILEGIMLSPGAGGSPVARHERGALWVGIPGRSESLERIAAGDGTSARDNLVMEEAYRRLPDSGLVRGWINPRALRRLLDRHVEGTWPAPLEILRSFVTAGLDTVRFIGFRRDLHADGAVADGVIGLDMGALPSPVVRALKEHREPSLSLPSPLPAGTILASAFRVEAEAGFGWLRHVASSDPRGPLRNFEFWMEEFRARTGLDLERDLSGALGERGWSFLLGDEDGATVNAVAILETRDPARVEETLLELREWFMEHLLGRTLGSVVPRIEDHSLNEGILHGLRLWTPIGDLTGPAFHVTDGHLVVGLGERAVRAGVDLLEAGEGWMNAGKAGPDPGSGAAWEQVRVVGPALARWIETRIGLAGSGREHFLALALADLLAVSDPISADLWSEGDTFRTRCRVRFTSD